MSSNPYKFNLHITSIDATYDLVDINTIIAWEGRIKQRLGSNVSNTAVMVIYKVNGDYSTPESYMRSALLIPKFDINGSPVSQNFRNNLITRYWDGVVGGGQALGFSVDELPEFDIVGLNHDFNFFCCQDPKNLDQLDPVSVTASPAADIGTWTSFNYYDFGLEDTLKVSNATLNWFISNMNQLYQNITLRVRKSVSKLEMVYLGFAGSPSGLQTYALTNTGSAVQRILTDNGSVPANGQVCFLDHGTPSLDVNNGTSVRVNKKTADGQTDYSLTMLVIGSRLVLNKKQVVGDLTNASIIFNISTITDSGTYYEYDIVERQVLIGSTWTNNMKVVLDKFIPSLLRECTDTFLPNPLAGQVLTYDAGLGKWRAIDPTGGGGSAFYSTLSDVSVTGRTAGSATYWNDSLGKYLPNDNILYDTATDTSTVTGTVTNVSATNNVNISSAAQSVIVNADLNVTTNSKFFTVNTSGNGDVNINSDGKILGTGDSAKITSTAGNIELDATGKVVLGGATGASLRSDTQHTELQCGAAANQYCRINQTYETAAQYATKIQAFTDAIPNTQYVVDAIGALGVSTLAGLSDVALSGPSGTGAGGQALTYNGTDWVNSAKIVGATDENVLLKSQGTGSISEESAANTTITAGTFLLAQSQGGDATLKSNSNNVLLQANAIVNATAGTGIDLFTLANKISLVPAAAAGSYARIGTNNKTAVQYATDIGSDAAAIPNVQYVTTAIANSSSPVASTYEYTVNTTTTPPPAVGYIRYDNAAQISAANLYFSHIDGTARDIEILLGLYPVSTQLVIQDANNTANYQQWTLNAVPVVTAGSYVTFSVTFATSGGTGTTNFPNNTKILTFFIVGSTGAPGTVTSVAALTLGTSGTDLSSTVANSTTTPVITLNVPTASATNRGALSAADWISFNAKGSGTVTAVSALSVGTTGTDVTSTVANSTTTPVITLNIPTASATNRGALSSADWTTFNSKGTVTNVSALTLGSTGTDVSSSVATGTTTPVITLNIPSSSATNRGLLTSTDWSTFNAKGNGTVTSVAALTIGTTGTDLSSTVATGTTTPVITIQVPTASGTNRGALSSTDWTTFNSKQNALTLTTTGTSGAATLVGATLNIPQYSGGGGAVAHILANPYPLCRINANITPATTQYYFNATSLATGTATGMRFMLYTAGSDSIRMALYRSNNSWDITTSTLIGMTTLTTCVGLSADTVYTHTLTAEAGQNLSLTAGEGIILAVYLNGSTSGLKGSTITSSTQAWQNTTDLPAGSVFPTNPASKATNSGTVPMLELAGTA